MKRSLTLFLIILSCAAAFAQDLPRIAVYVTGDVSDNEKSALGTRMLASLINSGRYMGIERSGAFLAELDREQNKQRSGAIDDGQISELGRQFGVKYVCIAAITPAFGSFQVSARIVDVETAVVVLIGESHSSLRTMNDLVQVSDEVVSAMFKGQARQAAPAAAPPAPEQAARMPAAGPAAPASDLTLSAPTLEAAAPAPQTAVYPKPPKTPKPPKPLSFWAGLGLDVLGAGIIAYGVYEEQNVKTRVDSGEYTSAEKSATNRNIAYGVGAAVLLGGITVHIFF